MHVGCGHGKSCIATQYVPLVLWMICFYSMGQPVARHYISITFARRQHQFDTIHLVFGRVHQNVASVAMSVICDCLFVIFSCFVIE